MHTDDPEEPLTLHLPPLSDELAVVVYDFLQDLILQYESRYFHQMRRHQQQCDRERQQQQAEIYFQHAQRSLPLEDGESF